MVNIKELTPGKVNIKELTPGKKYRIDFEDCCVNGYFTDVFVKYDDPADPETAVFENASIATISWNQYEVQEVE